MKGMCRLCLCCMICVLCGCNDKKQTVLSLQDVKVEHLSFERYSTDSLLLYPRSVNVWKNYLIVMEPQLQDSIYSVWNCDSLAYLFSCGRKGSGPNELIHPRDDYYAHTDSTFFILDSHIEREVSLEGKSLLVKRNNAITIPDAINQLVRLGHDHYIAAGLTDGSKNEHILYKDGDWQFFGEYPNKSKEREKRFIYNYKLTAGNASKNHICDFYYHQPRIRIYSVTGNLLEDIQVVDDGAAFSDDTPVFQDLKYNSDYIAVLYNDNRYTTKELFSGGVLASELQLWSWNGELKKRVCFDASFDIYALSDDNILYAIDSNNPHCFYVYDFND